MDTLITILLFLTIVLSFVSLVFAKYCFDYSKSMNYRHYRELQREYKKISEVLFEINEIIQNKETSDEGVDINNEDAFGKNQDKTII